MVMAALGSALLFCAWSSGLVAIFVAIRSFDEMINPPGPPRRLTVGLAGAAVVSLWLPWVTSADGQLTLTGWFALDAATVVAVVLLAAGVGTLAALPDRGGEHRDLLSLVLALALAGVITGNAMIGASGGWGADLSWGAAVTFALTTALAAVEAAHHAGWGPATRAANEDDGVDLTGELSRITNPQPF